MKSPVSHLPPLPPFPDVTFHDVVLAAMEAGEKFDLMGKLPLPPHPPRPDIDFTPVFYKRVHGRWRSQFRLREVLVKATRKNKQRAKEKDRKFREELREELRKRARRRGRRRHRKKAPLTS